MLTPKDERYQGVEKHSSGFKLLASMGWKEGEGLVRYSTSDTEYWLAALTCVGNAPQPPFSVQGPKRQGMKQHIKVRKNVENAGIGLVCPNSSGVCTISADRCFDVTILITITMTTFC